MGSSVYRGFGGNSGGYLATAGEVLIGSSSSDAGVWYVDSATGSDAASPRGKSRSLPLATIGQAITNATDGEVIVLLSTHAETISSAITLTKKLTFVGEGQSNGVPSPTLTMGHATADMFNINMTCMFQNVTFKPRVAGSAAGYVLDMSSANSVGAVFDGCRFEVNGRSTGPAVIIGGAVGTYFKDCTWVSTSTSSSSLPTTPVYILGASTSTFDGCTFDNGAYGFNANVTSYAACYIEDGGCTTMLRTSLLRGAKVEVSTGSPLMFHVPTDSGDGGIRL